MRETSSQVGAWLYTVHNYIPLTSKKGFAVLENRNLIHHYEREPSEWT